MSFSISFAQDCEEDIRKTLLEAFEKDKDGIIKDQFLLTQLKLTRHILKTTKTKSLEEHVKKQMATKEHAPIEEIQALYMGLKEKSPSLNYFKASNRLSNQDVKEYLEFELANGNEDFNEMDLAITWYMDEILKDQKKFTTQYNLLTFSTNIAKHRGLLPNSKEKNSEELSLEIKKLDKKLESYLKEVASALQQKFSHCQELLCIYTPKKIEDELSLYLKDLFEVSDVTFEEKVQKEVISSLPIKKVILPQEEMKKEIIKSTPPSKVEELSVDQTKLKLLSDAYSVKEKDSVLYYYDHTCGNGKVVKIPLDYGDEKVADIYKRLIEVGKNPNFNYRREQSYKAYKDYKYVLNLEGFYNGSTDDNVVMMGANSYECILSILDHYCDPRKNKIHKTCEN